MGTYYLQNLIKLYKFFELQFMRLQSMTWYLSSSLCGYEDEMRS